MPKPSRQLGLASIMIAVVVMAVSFSCLGVPGGSLAVVIFWVASMILLLTAPERRLGAWAWIFSIVPLMVIACLYVTWGVAWVTLGHEPKAGIEPPRTLGPVVAGIDVVTRMMLFGVTVSFFGSLVLATIESKSLYLIDQNRKTAALPFVGPVVWTLGYGFLHADPFRVLAWFLT